MRVSNICHSGMMWRYIVFIVLAAVLTYIPGLPGGFIYDDYFNFLQNPAIYNSDLSLASAWTAMQSGSAGPLGRPLSMLSFYINYQLNDISPLGYKLFNITIHVFNAILVFLVTRKLMKHLLPKGTDEGNESCKEAAFWITILWVVHPINLTAVLYVVQRMTSLSATFTLLGIFFYLIFRECKAINLKNIVVSLSVVSLMGIISILFKENGALLFAYIFVIECIIFKWQFTKAGQKVFLYAFYFLVIVIPLCYVIFELINGDLIRGYNSRSFTLYERVLTEARALWFYIYQIFIPQAGLFGLHHDDFIISKGLFDPKTTIFSIIALVSIVLIALLKVKKYAWFTFGICFFLAGHLIESTFLPLNLVHEHRNYIPSIGLLLILFVTIKLMMNRINNIPAKLPIYFLLFLFSFITINRAHDWSNLILLGERLVQRHPHSAISHYEMGYAYNNVYLQTKNPVFSKAAINAFLQADKFSSNSIQPAIALLHMKSMTGEEEEKWLVDRITTYLRNRQLSNTELIELHYLTNCQIQSSCSISAKTMNKFFTGMINNVNVKNRIKDDMLYIYSSFLVSQPGGEQYALEIMQDVAERNPDELEYQIKLISLLFTNERETKAQLLIEQLESRYGFKVELQKQ